MQSLGAHGDLISVLKSLGDDFLSALLEPEPLEPVVFSVPSLVDMVLRQHFLDAAPALEDALLRKRQKKLRREREVARKCAREKGTVDSSSDVNMGVPRRPLLSRLETKLTKPEKWPLPAFFPDVFHETAVHVSPLVSDWTQETVVYLLGMRQTAGTVVGALPPSIATLMKSFCHSHEKHGRKVGLTVGGRALSKHCKRCTQGWWGNATGTPQEINTKAEAKIRLIMAKCVWMNRHLLPHDVEIFEIRVAEGYGARWLGDGSEFRGFLEPPSLDGHDQGWVH